MQIRNVGLFIRSLILVQIFFICLIAGVTLDTGAIPSVWPRFIAGLSLNNPNWPVEIDETIAQELISFSNVELSGKKRNSNILTEAFQYVEQTPERMLIGNLPVLANIDTNNLETEPVLNVETAPIQTMPAEVEIEEANILPNHVQQNFSVYMYSTHTSETYAPQGGPARLEGQPGQIVKVGHVLQSQLEAAGVTSAFYDQIHDSPDYDKSYTNSRETIKDIVEKHPGSSAVFDLHRDSIPGLKQAEVVTVAGKKSAKILIIVGTDERKPHPNWRGNMEFAQKLMAQGEISYPGLIKGVRTKAGTYNQEFHPRALLLEFGSDINSFDEAAYAAQLFADVLLKVLQEEG